MLSWQLNENVRAIYSRAGEYDKIKYRDRFDQMPQYKYCNIIVGMTIGAFTETFLKNNSK